MIGIALRFALLGLLLAGAARAELRVELIDPRASDYLHADVVPEVLATGYSWTEGPLWVEEGAYLLFSDMDL